MNKLILVITVLVASASAYAYSPKDIYEALDVPEYQINPGIAGSTRTEKSVGGLICVKSILIVPNSGTTYECELLMEEYMPEEVEQGYPVK